jgi:DNA helicase-2/ATP-dependent DNA helicase PcrA
MRFHADLHVHSKYSRATSRDLDLEHLYYWAARKGVGVVGTGDFVHPQWLAELKRKLIPAEPGLFRLTPEIETAIAQTLPPSCRAPVRFMLQVEISTIYKKADRTRKIHHLIYAPDFATVDQIAARLGRIGNIASDGRPILGLDSRDLLEITLDSGPDAYLVPAHIWTPWFAALGSQSGFDSIEACYGDLASHIFAVETGLSSDPAMNWRVSFLDRYRLTSNSDAHSPGKLGREATRFDCAPDYFAIRHALKTGEGYVGTVEFFPEEGKYHLDGHRKCEARLSPRETLAHGGRCPVCGEPVTIGVAHRVEVLADRDEADVTPPPTAGKPQNLVPLPEVLSELTASGPATRTVERSYDRALAALGPELFILEEAPVEDIARAESSLLAEAVTRLRAGKVICEAGYDGEYGVIRLFEDSELARLTSGALLFEGARMTRKRSASRSIAKAAPTVSTAESPHVPPSPAATSEVGLLAALDQDQRRAAEQTGGPLIIVAGPGSGKTRTLAHRLAHLVVERGVDARRCLAITFTRRAAQELRDRLASLIPGRRDQVCVHTFHSLGLEMLRQHAELAGLGGGFRIAGESERTALLSDVLDVSERKARTLLSAISRLKRTRAAADQDVAAAMAAYQRALAARGWIDFDDLVGRALDLLAAEPAIAAGSRERFDQICVDEFQDVDEQQYRLLQCLALPGGDICVIGDPDQAIYGFRGADATCFERFTADFPTARTIELRRNYRSTGTIVAASAQVIRDPHSPADLSALARDLRERITIHAAPTEAAEAEYMVQTIEHLIGGHSFFSIDSGRAGQARTDLGFADFAVLYRTEAQSAALREALARSGIPYKTSAHVPIADQPAVRVLVDEIERHPGGMSLLAVIAAAVQALPQRPDGPGAAALALARGWLEALTASCEDRERLLEIVTLASEADFFDPRADRVSLMTMHAAKGLEFAVVFVVGLEDGLMPLRFGARDPATEPEERRLLYVAMTRAKERLYLTRALARLCRGRLQKPDASPFLADIEAGLVQRHQPALPRRKASDRQLELF